jgi:hypothetical protein
MKKNNSKKIVKVHDWRGELKRVELACGHFVERAVRSDRPFPKSGKLTCDRCAYAERETNEACPE